MYFLIAINLSCNTWVQTLDKGKEPVKKYWGKLASRNWGYFLKRCGYRLADSDVARLELIPERIYIIDSESLMNYKPSQSIKPLLKLDRTRATYFILKDRKIIGFIDAAYDGRAWSNRNGYGCIDSMLGSKFLRRINSNGLIHLYVSMSPSYHREMPFNVYKDDKGKYMSLRIWGDSIPLEKEILKIKNEMTQYDKRQQN